MKQRFLVLLNGKPIKRGTKVFTGECAELKFEQQMFSKYATRDNDWVEVLYM